jgi:hypothetical protein
MKVPLPGVGPLNKEIYLTFGSDVSVLAVGASASASFSKKEVGLADPITDLKANHALIQILPRRGLLRSSRPESDARRQREKRPNPRTRKAPIRLAPRG